MDESFQKFRLETHLTSSKNFSSFSAAGTSANLNSTGSLARGMSARTTSGLYLRRIISSVIVSEKFAVERKSKVINNLNESTCQLTYVLYLKDNAPREASANAPRTATDEIKALSHLVVQLDHDSGTWR
jgi:hypothetical protein